MLATLSLEEQHALIESHMQYAEKGAAAWCRRLHGKVDMEDLRSAAYMGLVHAATKFDPSKGFAFTTYSFHWIERYMYDDVYRRERRANGWMFHPTQDEINQGAKRHTMVCLANRGEFHTIADEDGFMEIQHDSGTPTPETLLLYKEHQELQAAESERVHRERLEAALSRAKDDRDRFIVRAAMDGKLAHEVAADLNISRERVRQLAERMDFTFPNKWSRWRDDATAPPVQEPSVITKGQLALPDARRVLREMLQAAAVGQIVQYVTLAEAIGCDVHAARGMLTSVRKTLLEEHRIVFGPIPHIGLKRLADVEILSVGGRSVKAVGRAAERGLRVLAAVENFDGLTNEEKIRHNTMMAQFGVLAHVVSDKVTKRIEERAVSPLLLPAMLDAMKESL